MVSTPSVNKFKNFRVTNIQKRFKSANYFTLFFKILHFVGHILHIFSAETQ